MNDDQYLLANAYFDGELTGDDLRIAEADPDVMSEVDRLRSLRSLLRDTDVPFASARTAAIAVAMSEFATLRGTADTSSAGRAVTGGHVTTINGRRSGYRRYLAVAAAVVAIGAVGVVVAGVIGSGSDDESSGADLAASTESVADMNPDDLTRAASATTLAMSTEMQMSDEMFAESAPALGTTGEVAGSESSATIAAGDIAEDSVGTGTTMVGSASSTPYPTSGGPIEPVADRDQTITTPGQLAGLGLLLADLRDAGTLGVTPETSCLFDDPAIAIVDETRYRFPEATRTVLVGLVAGDIEGHTLAIDPDNCVILVVGP